MILAQEMRPDSFDGVIGNEHIVQPLTKQIAEGSLSQSIMITGQTGTGKTTIAHVLATTIGAEVTEVDCGAEGSIDNIRGLIDNAQYTSLFSSVRVFVLDEVHKLSTAGQSALLRTLEEPREGVHYVLLTNEPTKVLKTLRTRCVVYTTSLPNNADIGVAVRRVIDRYGLKVENREDFWAIVQQSEGSLRQVYTLLEKLLAVRDGDGFISSADFHRAVGSIADEETPSNLASLVHKGQLKEAVVELDKLIKSGDVSPYTSLYGTYRYLRAIFLRGGTVDRDLISDILDKLTRSEVSWLDVELVVWRNLGR